MNRRYQVPLDDLNTFHIHALAESMIYLTNLEECKALFADQNLLEEIHFIGGGSNILLTEDIKGLTVLNQLKGKSVIHETDDEVHVKFMSGENWHECVLWCVENNLGGIENLSLIPGTIGAAPIQNIGAYGVELKDVFVTLEAIDVNTGAVHVFSNAECEFGYRDSIFKHKVKGQYFILSVTLSLSKQHVCHTEYGMIAEELQKMGVEKPDIRSVSDAVIKIRSSKLPNPDHIGNAGSFFKNPIVTQEHFQSLKIHYPDLPSYPVEEGIKVPAAWLIEHSGPSSNQSWKGYRRGDCGVHERQALVLVNYGEASGKEILELSTRIITSVQQRFNILLEREVNVW
ncbi:MAG: UDP-N-acetylmuramate dehydrogenase [Chitinophagaceae bacterium]|nr:UDP-N-acetylmuramate dehydrogenase [Chitinophagaceae bacterium]